MGPGTIGVAAAQINLLVNTVLATAYPGVAAALQYSFRLMYMPIGIFSVSVATAALPELARHAAERDYAAMRATLSWSLRLMLMLSVPATVGLMVLAHPIVELIYQRGEFNAESTFLVATALFAYAPGIIGYSIVKIASPTFYSLQDARTPVVVGLVTIALNVALNVWLNSLMGFRGLAIGTALAANINALTLLVLLSKRIGGLDERTIGLAFLKILAASAVMGAAAFGAELWLREVFIQPSLAARLIRVFGAIGIGMGTLALAAWALRISEFRQAIMRVLAKLR
jgi:putative peptidoglycan lipid II flippase